jgi:hypothetical protein
LWQTCKAVLLLENSLVLQNHFEAPQNWSNGTPIPKNVTERMRTIYISAIITDSSFEANQ